MDPRIQPHITMSWIHNTGADPDKKGCRKQEELFCYLLFSSPEKDAETNDFLTKCVYIQNLCIMELKYSYNVGTLLPVSLSYSSLKILKI